VPGRRLVVPTLLCAALTSTSACSWIFTQPLREDRSPYDYPVCSTNPAPPLVDTLLFVSNAGSTIYLGTRDNVNEKALLVSVGIVTATVYLLSAVYGYSNTNECQNALGVHKAGYQPPPIGTGGEVFLEPPATIPPQPGKPGDRDEQPDQEDPQHPRPRPKPPALPARPDAPRFGS
jgi:hypothetical protein